jgi:hypothetical protein
LLQADRLIPGGVIKPENKGKGMLNLNQKRSLGITLGIVEDELKRLQGIINRSGEDWLFSHFTDDLKPEERPLIDEKIRRLLEELASLKSCFDLHYSSKEFLLSSLLKAVALYLAVQLENAKSNKLKGYGEFAPGLKESLDPKLEGLLSLLNEMEAEVHPR